MSLGRSSLCTALLLLSVAPGRSQAQNALVLLRPSVPDTAVCAAGTAEPKLLTLRNPRIKGEDEVRLANDLGADAPGTSLDERRFKRLRKVRIKDLSEIESRDGILFVATGEGQKILAVPDAAVPKNSQLTLGQYAEMTLEGESQEGRKWVKQVLPLKSVWRLFVLSETITQEQALFNHANQEKSISQWAFYLTKVSSYRLKEANEGFTAATTGCLDRAMDRFHKGDSRAMEEAKELAQRLLAMAGSDPAPAVRLASIRKEEQDLQSRLRSGTQLRSERNWDEVLKVWEPLVVYRQDPAMKEFNEAYTDTLQKSHDDHVARAVKAADQASSRGMTLEAEAPFRQARNEYEIALKRKPDSTVASKGLREMTIRIALIDVKRLREAKQPGDAYRLTVKALKEQGDDERLTLERRGAGCEYGGQLFDQARGLVLAVSPGSAPKPQPLRKPVASAKAGVAMPVPARKVKVVQMPGEKAPFIDARGKLTQAMELCADDDKAQLLAQVNAALADFHVVQAKRATLRKLHATALLHLKAAQSFQSDRAGLDPLLEKALEPVQKRAQFQTGVVVSSLVPECAPLAQQFSSSIESALSSAGANVQLISQGQAAQTLQSIRSTPAQATDANYVILSGRLAVCNAAATPQARQVRSKSATPNGRYPQLQAAERDASRQFDDCRRANPSNEGACSGYRSNRDGLRATLAREPTHFFQDYSYTERTISTTGAMKLTLQVYDSVSRGTRAAGEATGSLSQSCLERSGVRPNDWGRVQTSTGGSGWSGFLKSLATVNQPGPAVEDVSCPSFDKILSLQTMAEQVSVQAQAQSTAAMLAVAHAYLDLAKRATDADLALENYISFALLSSDKKGAEYQQALAAIRGRDADLKPETALQ